MIQRYSTASVTVGDNGSILAMRVKFLLNPMARAQGGQRLWNRLQEACTSLGYVEGKDYRLEWTRAGQAVEQACRAAGEWDRVVAVGGDGRSGRSACASVRRPSPTR